MQKSAIPILFMVLIIGILISNCQRSLYFDKQAPNARAGNDTTIILPINVVMLKGAASDDPDGTIKAWQWTNISGPPTFTISNATAENTEVKNLIAGVYEFELKVTDNDVLSSKDTVSVIVLAEPKKNQGPVAKAGNDAIINLPTITVLLNAGTSTDPDNDIVSYQWTKIDGPASFNILDPNAVQTLITSLVEGVYVIGLKVVDAGGLFSLDTMRITVKPATVYNCGDNRPRVNAGLVAVGRLSQPRVDIIAASARNKILFAGGYIHDFFNGGYNLPSDIVDIFDITTQTTTTEHLSEARTGFAAIALGDKIFFAGGTDEFGKTSSRVDIYNVVSNTWSQAELSLGRGSLAAAVVGNKVLFVGGYSRLTPQSAFVFSNRVDIYDATTNTWSLTSLSEGRSDLTANTVNDKVYIAGGTNYLSNSDYGCTNRIDIYDASNNSWSVSSLSEAKGGHVGVNVNNKIYWAGGRTNTGVLPYASCIVEIRDIDLNESAFANLFQPNANFRATARNNEIVFFTFGYGVFDAGRNLFDIYNISNKSWSIGVLEKRVSGASIISVNNIIYVAGGELDGVLYNQLWKLEF